MKKIREFSRSYIFLSFLYVAVGVVLLIWPTLSIQMIGKGVGVIMLVVGATYGVIYFTSDKRQEGYLQLELVIAIICAAFGVFVLLTPDFMRMVLPFAMATVLLVGAIVKIQSAVSMRRLMIRRWYLALILAFVIIALGIFLLVYPFAEDYQMLIYIGICLIADGMTNLIGFLAIRLRTRKLEKIQKKNPGVDVKALIEDEWAQSDTAKAEKKARKREMKEQKRKEQENVVDGEAVEADSAPHNDPAREPDSEADSTPHNEADSASGGEGVQPDSPETGIVTTAKAAPANTFSKTEASDTDSEESSSGTEELQDAEVGTAEKEDTLS